MTHTHFTSLPVRRIFLRLAIPNILSMVFSSIYMMADGVFVGRFIGEHALAAVNLIMPIMLIVFALSNMIAVGSSVKVSTAMGEGDMKKARRIFSASVLMIVGVGFFFSVVGILFAKPLIFALIKDSVLAEMAYSYLRVFIVGLPFIMPLFAMDNFLRVCGKAKYSMYINIAVSILNIALDWLFIAKLGLGIEFSAIASVASIFLGAVLAFAPFLTKKIALHFSVPRIHLSEVIGIFYNGSSEFFSSIAGSFLAALVNGILLTLGGAVAVASFGIVMYIDTLLVGILFGVLDGITPAVSYNVGAGEKVRTFSFFKISCVFSAVTSLVCMAVILLFPEALANIFTKNHSAEVISMTTAALLLYAPSYLFTWYNMVTSAFLTAMDKPRESMVIMLFRTIVFPPVCLVALTFIFGVYGVFLTMTASSALTFFVSLVVWRKASLKYKLAI